MILAGHLVLLVLTAAQAEAGPVIYSCRTDDDCLEYPGEGH